MKKEQKTNVVRILERSKKPFKVSTYECDEFVDGVETAEKLNLPLEQTFKTLVTIGKSKKNYVFVLPVNCELDMKKAAKAVKEKSIEMIHVKDIFALTGYIRGGCSPIGMKKQFPIIIDASAKQQEVIYFSGGKRGVQIQMNPEDLLEVCKGSFAAVTIE